jgi:hypothetical protein
LKVPPTTAGLKPARHEEDWLSGERMAPAVGVENALAATPLDANSADIARTTAATSSLNLFLIIRP